MKKIFLTLLATLSLLMTGCGVVVRKSPEPDALHQREEDNEEKLPNSAEVSFILPGPAIIYPEYPYDISGTPHGNKRNSQPGACFITICY